jgi:hypothetical protein
MLFQVKPSSAGCFKSSQALQVVSRQAKLCRLFQVKPSSAACFKSSQALQVISSQAKLSMLFWLDFKTICRAWFDLKQPAEPGLT